jgi:hypothetical protein
MYISVRDWFKRANLAPYGYAVKRMKDPTLLNIEEVYRLAEAIGISGLQLLKILSVNCPPD